MMEVNTVLPHRKFGNHFFVSDMWTHLYSTSVSLGQQAIFHCYGEGSYLYWFIDGVNSDDMTTEELQNRGISLSGYYNYLYPYYPTCYTQDSYLNMTGSCLNNNTKIFCVILGTRPPPSGGNTTSSTAFLTVQG